MSKIFYKDGKVLHAYYRIIEDPKTGEIDRQYLTQFEEILKSSKF